MSQSPLAPPPQTGQPIDGWLYLLWRRLTATGQMLWSSIVPGTSADVAAVVTDETGSPGSLVFSGNPTLTGCTVSGAAFTSRGITDNATATVLNIDISGNVGIKAANSFDISPAGTGQYPAFASWATSISTLPIVAGHFSNDTLNASMFFVKSRGGSIGTNVACTVNDGLGSLLFRGADGTNYKNSAQIYAQVEGTVSTGVVPGTLRFLTTNTSGTLTDAMQISNAQVVSLGGASAAPALKVVPVASQARWIEVTGATSSGNPTLGVSGGILAISASVAITGVVSTSGYTVATLPAGTVGQRAYVTDALAPAYGVAVAGGGAVTVPVFYNGAAWICA